MKQIHTSLLKSLLLGLLLFNSTLSLYAQSGTGFTYTTSAGSNLGTISGTWTGSFTFESWIKLPASPPLGWSNIVFINHPSGFDDFYRPLAIFYNNTGNVATSFFHCKVGDESNWNAGCDIPSTTWGNWMHLAIVASSGVRKFYINGAESSTSNCLPNPITSVNAPLNFIGKTFYASSPLYLTLGAQLSEVRRLELANSKRNE